MLKKLIFSLWIVALTLVFIQSAFAEVNRIDMQVDGMTCPFCVYGIEKKLKALQEVIDAEANLKTGIVDIELDEDGSLDIERLNEAVRESGFSPGRIKIKATGKLTKYEWGEKQYPALRVTGSRQVFIISPTPNHEKEEFLGEKKLSEMEKATEGGKKEITVTGYVHSHPAGVPPALSVESFEVQ